MSVLYLEKQSWYLTFSSQNVHFGFQSSSCCSLFKVWVSKESETLTEKPRNCILQVENPKCGISEGNHNELLLLAAQSFWPETD
jgi:hypothetical protein